MRIAIIAVMTAGFVRVVHVFFSRIWYLKRFDIFKKFKSRLIMPSRKDLFYPKFSIPLGNG